ncbi:MAG: hypothetical protein ACTHLO_14505 [Pseudolabrys sp.]
MPHQIFSDDVTRDLREAQKTREDYDLCVIEYGRQRAELRLTIMQSRIRVAEVMATLRRISRFVDGDRLLQKR